MRYKLAILKKKKKKDLLDVNKMTRFMKLKLKEFFSIVLIKISMYYYPQNKKCHMPVWLFLKYLSVWIYTHRMALLSSVFCGTHCKWKRAACRRQFIQRQTALRNALQLISVTEQVQRCELYLINNGLLMQVRMLS